MIHSFDFMSFICQKERDLCPESKEIEKEKATRGSHQFLLFFALFGQRPLVPPLLVFDLIPPFKRGVSAVIFLAAWPAGSNRQKPRIIEPNHTSGESVEVRIHLHWLRLPPAWHRRAKELTKKLSLGGILGVPGQPLPFSRGVHLHFFPPDTPTGVQCCVWHFIFFPSKVDSTRLVH